MSTILLTNIISCFDMFSKHFQWNKQLHLSNLYCINAVKTTMEPIDGRTRCIKELGIKILSFYLRFRSIQMVRETESENGNLKNWEWEWKRKPQKRRLRVKTETSKIVYLRFRWFVRLLIDSDGSDRFRPLFLTCKRNRATHLRVGVRAEWESWVRVRSSWVRPIESGSESDNCAADWEWEEEVCTRFFYKLLV
jgi:hypothetical protein